MPAIEPASLARDWRPLPPTPAPARHLGIFDTCRWSGAVPSRQSRRKLHLHFIAVSGQQRQRQRQRWRHKLANANHRKPSPASTHRACDLLPGAAPCKEMNHALEALEFFCDRLANRGMWRFTPSLSLLRGDSARRKWWLDWAV